MRGVPWRLWVTSIEVVGMVKTMEPRAQAVVDASRRPDGMPVSRSIWAGCARCGSTAAPSSAAPRRWWRGAPSRKSGRRPGCCAPSPRIDLTTLAGDDTPGNVRRLCAKARQPVRAEILEALGVDAPGHPRRRPSASTTTSSPRRSRRWLGRASPSPPSRPASRPARSRTRRSWTRSAPRCAAGAAEIDIVISRAHVLTGDWRGALRRGARLPRGLRRRAHEDDPGHRRAGHAAQRRAWPAWSA